MVEDSKTFDEVKITIHTSESDFKRVCEKVFGKEENPVELGIIVKTD